MAFTTDLWRVQDGQLHSVQRTRLDAEQRLEDWLARDASLLGLDLLVIGRQVRTSSGKYIDLLALDDSGTVIVIELKRDLTPREVVAQVLDYASWVVSLSPDDLDGICRAYTNRGISDMFQERFGSPLPESVGTSHAMTVVASELDDASERIVQYLQEHHRVPINVVFFNCFQSGGNEFVARSWLTDPEEAAERSSPRVRAPWSGLYLVNTGEEHGKIRNWDDCRRFGYLAGGGSARIVKQLRDLEVGSRVIAHVNGRGYVGYGVVRQAAVPINEYRDPESGKRLAELPVQAPEDAVRPDDADPDTVETVVGIKWLKTFGREEAKWFKGAYANQNVVSRIRQPPSVEFIREAFGIGD